MLYKSVSSKSVIAKVYRDLQLKENDRWLDMLEWIGEALAHIGAFSQFEKKQLLGVSVSNYRAILPCDLYNIIQISRGGQPLQYLSGSFDSAFHCETSSNLHTTSKYGYTINGNYINTNFTDTTIDLAYTAFETDDDGFPMIPDDISYKEAIVRYIVMKLKYPDYVNNREGMTEGKYNVIKEEWHWYCAQAAGKAMMPSLDQMESIKNQWVRLIPEINRHSDFFNKLNDQEKLYMNSSNTVW
tara:strand:+ start:1675 stop:2400 length:726 start_codon:yes stop_codon:yes gene_type:complete